MRVLLHLFYISLFALSGVFPNTTFSSAGALAHGAIKIQITHSHEHEHDHHHDGESENGVPLAETAHSDQSNPEESSPADKHHSNQHSHEQIVSCGHIMCLGTSHFETAAIDFSNAHSFEFKRSVPPNRALSSIFRPPILA
jgi:hypothetical protein